MAVEKDPIPSSDDLRIIQFTDTHLFTTPTGTFDGVNTLASFEEVIDLARRTHWPMDAVVMTGDLVHDTTPEAYRLLRQCLTRLEVPVYCIPGNHDKPEMMVQVLPGVHVHLVGNVCIGHWQLIFLSTHAPGRAGGHLDEPELERLNTCLQTYQDKPALVCLHHPPVPIQSPWMDAMALDNPEAFFEVIDRFTEVRAVIWGHIHQAFETLRKGVWLLSSPSTCLQFKPRAMSYAKDSRRAGYRWLILEPNGRIQTGIQRLEEGA